MATISGPPARPSFTGCGTPGIQNEMLPSTTPSAMPMKIGIRLGWLRRLRELEEPLGMGYRKFGTHDRHPVAQLQLQIPCSHQVDTRTVDACNGDAARGADAQFGECLAVQLGFGDKYSA